MKDRVPWHAAGAGLLLALTLLAYVPSLDGEFLWDDRPYILENPHIRQPGGLARMWLDLKSTPQYYPLVFTTYWIEHRLWGFRPIGYHLVNVLFHAVNAILLWIVLRRLAVPGAWLAGAIFALHPVHVESVAWIAERKNVLSGAFYLLALLAYFRFCGIGRRWRKEDDHRSMLNADLDKPGDHAVRTAVVAPENGRGSPAIPLGAKPSARWAFYGLALILFACALLSKTVTCSLPVVIALLIWWRRGRLTAGDLIPLVPMLILGAGMGLMTAWVERYYVGAGRDEWALPFLDRCLLAGRAFWFYIGKIIWPAELSFIYPRWQIDSGAWVSYVYPAAAAGLLVPLWLLRRRIGVGAFIATLFYAVTIFPALGFFRVYFMRFSWVADHFQYLASIGPIALASAIITVSAKRLQARPSSREPTGRIGKTSVISVVSAGMLLAVLGVRCWAQNTMYISRETLWGDTIVRNPTAWIAHNNLGLVYHERGELDAAARHYVKALALKSDLPETHGNMGAILAEQGRLDEALVHFREAVRMDPNSADALFNLAAALARGEEFEEAINAYRKVLRLQPGDADTHCVLGLLLEQRGRLDEAIAEYEAALRLDPDHEKAREALANVTEDMNGE